MIITKISIKNPVFATMMMLALVVLGFFSIQRMQVDQFPSIDFATVVVQTEYPGASPESVENDVTRKLEEAINTVAGLKNLTSKSYEGISVIIAEFNLNINSREATNDIREKVAIVRPALKAEVKEPKILKADPSDREILSLAVSSPNMSFGELSSYVEKRLKKQLEVVGGVGKIDIIGQTIKEVNIEIDPEKLKRLGVAVEQVSAALRSNNADFPVGNIRDSLYQKNIQIKSKIKDIEAFGNIPVSKQGASIIYLKDVASINHGAKELESVAKYNGNRIVALNIFKAQEQNSIQIVKAMKEKLSKIQKDLPIGMNIEIIRDSSIPIDKAVKNVFHTIIEGAILTILIVFLFLNSWRSTVITGLTLPVSLIGTFLFMYWFGFTINMITLMALSICVGLLIDDAIVVRENIVRHVRMGKDHKTASLEGTQEIGLAVLATTLSIVAVFLPVGFMGGIIGQFFHQFGITVVVAVLISMFVSFTLDPMLSSIWPDPPQKAIPRWNLISRFAQWFEERMDDLAAFYQKMLRLALNQRFITVLLSIGILVFSVFATKFIGKEFVPAADYSEMVVNYSTPSGSSLEYTSQKSQQIEKILKAIPEVKNMYSSINAGGTSGKNNVKVYIKLLDKKERQAKNLRSTHELNQAVREALQNIVGISVTNAGAINPVGKNKLIEISLQGQDLKVMEKIATQTMEQLSKIQGLVDLDSSNKELKKIYAVRVNQDLAFDQNLTPARISSAIKPLFEGEVLSTWRADDGEDYDVRLKMNAANRQLDQLKQIPLLYQSNVANPQLLSLEQVANIEMDFGANQINRKNLSREIQIDANIHDRASSEVNADVQKVLESIKMPAGYRFDVGGDSKDMQESGMYAMQALALGVIFIYMVIASQFGRFIQPLSIMSSLPFTLIGVVGALYLFQSSLNLFSIIGVVMLMGLVTKNAILLIDYANQLQREEGYNIHDSLLEAAKVRLRPILMTTLAMIFGMVPLALGLAEGSEQRAPMGQAIIGGVITSSVLSLVVVPVIYSLLENMVLRLSKKKINKATE